MWEAEKLRPAEFTRERPRESQPMTVATLEAMAEKGGYELPWQDLNELARVVLDGIRDEQFVIMIGRESIGAGLHERADHLGAGECPPYGDGGMLG
jgi:hypothetical protein